MAYRVPWDCGRRFDAEEPGVLRRYSRKIAAMARGLLFDVGFTCLRNVSDISSFLRADVVRRTRPVDDGVGILLVVSLSLLPVIFASMRQR